MSPVTGPYLVGQNRERCPKHGSFGGGSRVLVESGTSPREGETVVVNPAWANGLLWLGFPAAGVVVLLLVKSVAGWVAGLGWAPFQGPFRLVAEIPEPWATLGAIGVGAVGGLVVAMIGASESARVTLSAERVTYAREDVARSADTARIAGAFLDGNDLVVQAAAGEELIREKKTDLKAEALRAAFEAHGARWLDADPYLADYRRWVEDAPDLPAGANVLLKARQRALDKNNAHDISELRSEVGKLGVVVRDEGKRQYWRQTRT